MVKIDECSWSHHETVPVLAFPCFKNGRDDPEDLETCSQLIPGRKMTFLYEMSLRIPNEHYVKPSILPWTGALPTAATRQGCLLPEVSRSASTARRQLAVGGSLPSPQSGLGRLREEVS